MENNALYNLNELDGGTFKWTLMRVVDEIIANIQDPNTVDGKRQIDIKFVFTTDEYREKINLEYDIKHKLAPQKGGKTEIALGVSPNGKQEWYELRSGAKGQTFIDDDGRLRDDAGRIIEDEEDNY